MFRPWPPCRIYQQHWLAGCWWPFVHTGFHPHPIALVLIRPVLLRSGLPEQRGEQVFNLFFGKMLKVFNPRGSGGSVFLCAFAPLRLKPGNNMSMPRIHELKFVFSVICGNLSIKHS
jgi:hypothetical protein